MKRALGAVIFLVATGAARSAHAQSREPLCVPVEAQRLASGLTFDRRDEGVGLVVVPFESGEARFLVVAPVQRDGHAVLLGTRVGDDLHRVGEPFVVGNGEASHATGVAIGDGALVLALANGAVVGARVPVHGDASAWQSLASAPTGFVWLTATHRNEGAIALAGTADGAVTAMRFDAHGALVGGAHRWSRQVGGPMQLLPTSTGPASALLGRPIAGTGPDNEQARMQVLVTLDDALDPVGQPFTTGFAQFPLAAVERGRSVVIVQWALQQGVAIATLPIGEHRIGEQLPRLWYAQPPLEGATIGHGATVDANGIVYDLVTYGEHEGGVHGHLAWIPPSGAPVIRRDVLPLRAGVMSAPALVPAADGLAVLVAVQDETGGAIDAYHVRCDLVNVRAVDETGSRGP